MRKKGKPEQTSNRRLRRFRQIIDFVCNAWLAGDSGNPFTGVVPCPCQPFGPEKKIPMQCAGQNPPEAWQVDRTPAQIE